MLTEFWRTCYCILEDRRWRKQVPFSGNLCYPSNQSGEMTGTDNEHHEITVSRCGCTIVCNIAPHLVRMCVPLCVDVAVPWHAGTALPWMWMYHCQAWHHFRCECFIAHRHDTTQEVDIPLPAGMTSIDWGHSLALRHYTTWDAKIFFALGHETTLGCCAIPYTTLGLDVLFAHTHNTALLDHFILRAAVHWP